MVVCNSLGICSEHPVSTVVFWPTVIQTQISPNEYRHQSTSQLNREKELLNMEKKNLKNRLRQLGWAGIIFFTVKGTLSLLFGAWLLQKLGCAD